MGVAPALDKSRFGRDYVNALAGAIAAFATARPDELLGMAPALLCSELDATRAELWLWDDQNASGYLTHAFGRDAEHRRDYAMLGKGPVGKVAEARRTIENVALVTFGGDHAEFSRRSQLSHFTAYPLLAKDCVAAVLAVYSSGEAPAEMVRWWRMFAEVASIKVTEALSSQEQQKQITQLSLLFEATRLLNSTLDLAELLELILKIARTEVHADRGSVFLVDHKHQELWSIVASGLEAQEIRMPFGRGVAGRVAASGDIVNVENAYALEYFESGFDERFGYTTRSLLCLPIRHRTGDIVGVIQLLNKTTASSFSADDIDFLDKLSGHMAMALENARLHREALEKQRLEKELALARAIQRSLLPDAPPAVPGFELAVINDPCFEVGGDYYDFLSLGPQTLLLVVADVEGKGVSSAMVMSNLQATLRALVMHLHSLEVLTLSLNEMIYNDTKSQKYLSMFLGLVDTRRNGLHYINAGHVPPILLSGETDEFRTLEEGGIVIGLFPHAEYRRGSVKLAPGDVLVCCTDGILEACNAEDEEYGMARMKACVSRNRDKGPQEIVDAVLAEVTAWTDESKLKDDKVLMIMKVTGTGAILQGKTNLPAGIDKDRRQAARLPKLLS